MDLQRIDRRAAIGLHDHVACQHRNAQRTGTRAQVARGLRARINHLHLGAGLVQSEHGVVGHVVVGEDHGALAWQHRVTADVGGHGAGQHDARQVVVGEHQGALNRTGGQNHLLGAHLPQAFAWCMGRDRAGGEVIGAALGQGHEVVVLVAKRGRARQQAHLGHGAQSRQRVLEPSRRRDVVDDRVAREQPAPHFVLFVGQHHTGAALGRGQGRTQAGQATTHDEHIAVFKTPLVTIGVVLGGRLTQAAGLADVVLKEVPGLLRSHEGFVIKTGGQETRKPIVDRAPIEVDAGLGVDWACAQALHQRHLGHAGVGHRAGAIEQLHQGVGLFNPCAQNTARAVVFPAARDHANALRQHRRGQGVARKTLVGFAVELE